MRTPIRTWYIKTYPTDDVGPTLNPTITFADLWQALKQGSCVYSALGGEADSIVRERIFAALANFLDVDYNHIYNLWSKKRRN